MQPSASAAADSFAISAEADVSDCVPLCAFATATACLKQYWSLDICMKNVSVSLWTDPS